MKTQLNLRYEEETQTIRLMPQNYWVASVRNGVAVFDSWDGATKSLFEDGTLSEDVVKYFFDSLKINENEWEKVSKEVFYNEIGPRDVVHHIEQGPYPYTSKWSSRSGILCAKSVPSRNYPHDEIYYINRRTLSQIKIHK